MPVDSHKSCFHFNAVVFQLSFEQPAKEIVKTIRAYSGSEHVLKDQEPFRWGQKFILRPQSGKSGDYRDLPSERQSWSNTIKIENFSNQGNSPLLLFQLWNDLHSHADHHLVIDH